jgi:hypothetical protein
MFCDAQSTDRSDPAWDAINRARLSYELEPYWAPRPRYQVACIFGLVATVGILALL